MSCAERVWLSEDADQKKTREQTNTRSRLYTREDHLRRALADLGPFVTNKRQNPKGPGTRIPTAGCWLGFRSTPWLNQQSCAVRRREECKEPPRERKASRLVKGFQRPVKGFSGRGWRGIPSGVLDPWLRHEEIQRHHFAFGVERSIAPVTRPRYSDLFVLVIS